MQEPFWYADGEDEELLVRQSTVTVDESIHNGRTFFKNDVVIRSRGEC